MFKKLCVGFSTSIALVSPMVVMTSCSKTPDQPIKDVEFNVDSSTMTSETIATINLNWTPTGNSLEFSNPLFKYNNDTKSANVSVDEFSRPQIFKLTFTEAPQSDITDGKLTFHCKDKTLQKEYDTSIQNIKLDKYQAKFKLTGGSVSLSGTNGIAGKDDNKWQLMKDDHEITDGVTMFIVPVSPAADKFPSWITIDETPTSPTYHQVMWSDVCTDGQYKFKVKAQYDTAIFESAEITLTINPEDRYTIKGIDVRTVGLVHNPTWSINPDYQSDEIKLLKNEVEVNYEYSTVSASDPVEKLKFQIDSSTKKKLKINKSADLSFASENEAKAWKQNIDLNFFDSQNHIITTIKNIEMCSWEECEIVGMPDTDPSKPIGIDFIEENLKYSNAYFSTDKITLKKKGVSLPIGGPTVSAIDKSGGVIEAYWSSENKIEITEGSLINQSTLKEYNTSREQYGTCKCTLDIRYHNNNYFKSFWFAINEAIATPRIVGLPTNKLEIQNAVSPSPIGYMYSSNETKISNIFLKLDDTDITSDCSQIEVRAYDRYHARTYHILTWDSNTIIFPAMLLTGYGKDKAEAAQEYNSLADNFRECTCEIEFIYQEKSYLGTINFEFLNAPSINC